MDYLTLRKEYVDQIKELCLMEGDEPKQLASEMLIALALSPDDKIQATMFYMTINALLM